MMKKPLKFLVPLTLAFALAGPAEAGESIAAGAKRSSQLLAQLIKSRGPQLAVLEELKASTQLAQKGVNSAMLDGPMITDYKPGFMGMQLTLIGEVTLQRGEWGSDRGCDAIRSDWNELALLYADVNNLLLELDAAYRSGPDCEPCVVEILAKLGQETQSMDEIGNELIADGTRIVKATWTKKERDLAFKRFPVDPSGLALNRLAYYAYDAESQIAEANLGLEVPNGFSMVSPLKGTDIEFDYEGATDSICSEGFAIRFDLEGFGSLRGGMGGPSEFGLKAQVPIHLSLQIKPYLFKQIRL